MDYAPFVEIRLARRFAVPAERVFDAWTEPSIAGRWLFATATRPVPRVAIDARAGGRFRFEHSDGGDEIQAGRFLEVVRPRRLVFTMLRSKEVTRVLVEIVPEKGGCRLTLVHESVLREDARQVEGRWEGMLYGLATIL